LQHAAPMRYLPKVCSRQHACLNTRPSKNHRCCILSAKGGWDRGPRRQPVLRKTCEQRGAFTKQQPIRCKPAAAKITRQPRRPKAEPSRRENAPCVPTALLALWLPLHRTTQSLRGPYGRAWRRRAAKYPRTKCVPICTPKCDLHRGGRVSAAAHPARGQTKSSPAVNRSHTGTGLAHKLSQAPCGAMQLRSTRAQTQRKFAEISPQCHADHLQPALLTLDMESRDPMHHHAPLHQCSGRQLREHQPHRRHLSPRRFCGYERKLCRKARRTRKRE